MGPWKDRVYEIFDIFSTRKMQNYEKEFFKACKDLISHW